MAQDSSAKPWMTVAVEGISDEAAARRLLDFTGFAVGPIHGGRGKDQLDRNLRAYSLAARHGPWLVLRDLDRAECAPSLRGELEPSEVPDQFLLRIATRSIEAWLLADHQTMARALGISAAKIPAHPEELDDPKRALVSLARLSSKRELREDLVPARGISSAVGPGYTARLVELFKGPWNPEAAARRSPSLARCLAALRDLHARLT